MKKRVNLGPSLGKKYVKINQKTWIEVNENIPDEQAIEEYLKKLENREKRPIGRLIYKEKKNG